jgi:cell division protein FtsI/penicillin-binding protein 2
MLRVNLAAWRCVLALIIAAVPLNAAAQPVDITLQGALTRSMGTQRGTAIVLDVHSGRILASSHLDVAARRVAAPGSSIKPFTLLALLESGKVNQQTALVCKRSVSISGHKLDCSHPQTAEPLDPAAALAYSCNSYFTTVAMRLSPKELRNNLLRDGFASSTALASNEGTGTVALAHSPEQLQLQAIGEWGVLVTPLELAKAYRSLALLQPKHDENLSPLFAGLEQSVAYGMGHEAQPVQPMKVAGKTGTTSADEGSWTHAWFAGYAPASDPEIVIVVFLEKGHGGSDAAEVARQVFDAFAKSHSGQAAQARGAQP